MGEHSGFVTSSRATLMFVIITFLVFLHSSTVSLGVSPFPGDINTSLYTAQVDSLNHLSNNDKIINNSTRDFSDFSSKEEFRLESTAEYGGLPHNEYNNLSRESSLKKLLENLAELQQHSFGESVSSATKTSTFMDIEQKSRRSVFSEKWPINQISPKSRSDFLSDILLRFYRNKESTPDPRQDQVQLEVLSDGHKKISRPPTKTAETREQDKDSIQNYISLLKEILKLKESGSSKVSQDFELPTDPSSQTGENNMFKNIHVDNRKNDAMFTSARNNPINKLVSPTSSAQTIEFFRTPDAVSTKSHQTNDVNSNAYPYSGNDFLTTSEANMAVVFKADPVQSLIRESVKKMEGILKSKFYQYDSFFASDNETSDDNYATSIDDSFKKDDAPIGSDYTRVGSSLENTPISEILANYPIIGDTDADNNGNDKSFVNENVAKVDMGDITADVVKAVASRKVQKDAEFWRRVSVYLDSDEYLSRTRRSSEGKKRLRKPQTVTYGHVMPCEYNDRFYCLNGGTCVFVGALDIRTCRCPIGYTGVRCELIDQEYILSLLTDTLIFSL